MRLRTRPDADGRRPAERVRIRRLAFYDGLEAEPAAPRDGAEPVAIAESPALVGGDGLDRDRPPRGQRVDRHLRPELARTAEEPAAECRPRAVADATRADVEPYAGADIERQRRGRRLLVVKRVGAIAERDLP